MESILLKVLWLVALLVVATVASRREASSVRQRRAPVGVLYVPASSRCVACLTRPRGPVPCAECGQQWFVPVAVPAAEESEDGPGDGVSGVQARSDLTTALERVGNLLGAANGLLDRLARLLTLVPTFTQFLLRWLRLLLTIISGLARGH